MKRNCDVCETEYIADERNLKRGWGLCCSKSCAASKREKSKPNYDAKRVERNNVRRAFWNVNSRTAEGYRVDGGVAYNEFDEPVYNIDPYEDSHDCGWDSHK